MIKFEEHDGKFFRIEPKLPKKKHCRDCDDAEDCCPADLDDIYFYAIEEKK